MKQLFSLFTILILLSAKAQDTLPSLEWMAGFGGLSNEDIWGATIDNDGNIITVGWFDGTTDLDPGPGVSSFTSQGFRNGFIQKSDSAGNFLWGNGIICNGYLEVYDVATTSDGSVLVGGFFVGKDSVDLDPDPLSTHYVPADSTIQKSFMVKYDSQGQFQWAIDQEGGTYKLIRTDEEGNIFILGSFFWPFDIDPDPNIQNYVNPYTGGERDCFIQKLDSNGNQKWIRTLIGAGETSVSGLALNSLGDVVVSGYLEGAVNFDEGVSSKFGYPQADKNGFIFTMDSTGGFKSINMIQGSSDSEIRDLEVDRHDNIYVAGWYDGNDVDFDPGSPINGLQPGYNQGYFLMKTDATGTPVWVHAFDHNVPYGEFRQKDVCLGGDQSVYFGGFIESAMHFDPNNPNEIVLPTYGHAPFQIAYDSTGTLSWAKSYPHKGGVTAKVRKLIVKGDDLFMFGSFYDTLNLEPSSGFSPIMANGSGSDAFFSKQKLPKNCVNQDTTIQIFACDSMIAPNGMIYYNSVQYTDSLFTKGKCDSLVHYDIHIDLPVNTTVTLDSIGNQLQVPSGAEFYQWINCDTDTIVPGATNNFYSVQVPGNYAVIITNGECADTSACTASLGIGLTENLSTSSISIYPNPTDGKVYLHIDPRDIRWVQVYDFSGRLIQRIQGENVIDLSGLPQGTYTLLVKTAKDVSAAKILKT